MILGSQNMDKLGNTTGVFDTEFTPRFFSGTAIAGLSYSATYSSTRFYFLRYWLR